MAKILHQLIGSLCYLQGFYTSQVVSKISSINTIVDTVVVHRFHSPTYLCCFAFCGVLLGGALLLCFVCIASAPFYVCANACGYVSALFCMYACMYVCVYCFCSVLWVCLYVSLYVLLLLCFVQMLECKFVCMFVRVLGWARVFCWGVVFSSCWN